MSSDQVYFLFGTESGNSEKMATIGCMAAKALGYDAVLLDMAKFEPAQLKDWKNLFMVISTNGDGDMPLNAESAWEDAQAQKLTGLGHLNYAILALGDSSYDYFCQAGIDWDNYLSEAGARAIAERCDVDSEYYKPSITWLTEALAQFSGKDEDDVSKVIEEVLNSNPAAQASTKDDTWSQSNPWKAEVLEKRNLCGAGSSKAVRHYSLNLKGSDIVYKPGDCIEVLPVNNKELVEKLIAVMGWSGEENVRVSGKPMNIREALEKHLEIRQPTLKLLKLLGSRSTSAELKKLLASEDKEAIENFSYGHDVLSLVEEYTRPPAPKTDFKSKIKAMFGKPEFYPRVQAEVFVNYLKTVQARAYSIASSCNANEGEVHLTIADVRYTRKGREHSGACSVYLADRINQGDKVNCWLLPNKYFMLPENDELPIIMVGPGTGIAPFRGFLQERAFRKATGKNWLFFGDRESANDFLYREELEAFQQSGLLTRLDLAFSRDQQEKVYVQHKMQQAGSDIYDWLQQGAVFYICGDAKNMAHDVEQTLLAILKEHGGLTVEAAAQYLKNMQREQRYLKDVY